MSVFVTALYNKPITRFHRIIYFKRKLLLLKHLEIATFELQNPFFNHGLDTNDEEMVISGTYGKRKKKQKMLSI